MWTHRSFKDPAQNSGTVSVPEYKVETLHSGTKVGVYILGSQSLNTAPFCAGAQALVLGHQVWIWPKISVAVAKLWPDFTQTSYLQTVNATTFTPNFEPCIAGSLIWAPFLEARSGLCTYHQLAKGIRRGIRGDGMGSLPLGRVKFKILFQNILIGVVGFATLLNHGQHPRGYHRNIFC